MKKTTTIIQDNKQTRATIPKKFVDELSITKEDKIEWEMKQNKLKGELKKRTP